MSTSGCLLRTPYCVTHEVAANYKLERGQYNVSTTAEEFPGATPGKPVGGWYGWNSFLNRKIASRRCGIYTSEPFDASKTPVLFVHGLVSDPYTWSRTIKCLTKDPQITSNFQFWFYAYPTSTPLLNSGAVFREHFHSFVRDIEKEHRISLQSKVILAGHSLGGILCKTLVSDSDDILWNKAFQCPIDDLKLEQSERELLRKSFFFEPSPYVSRVCFFAPPHRGSRLAESGIGRLGMKIVNVPGFIADLDKNLKRRENLSRVRPGFREYFGNPLSSVASLQPSAPVTRLVAELPVDPDTPFHTIVGRKDESEAGDGIVSIKSSRLAGAISEIVVNSGHNVHQSRDAARIFAYLLKCHIGLISEDKAHREIRKIKGVGLARSLG
ncbi:MAG: alpha/beta fold hydrolase [Verrucomicrobiales bacterium]|nr:alpha/beta fold hydrolase [Verrucomicrobiales bacterium]